MPEASTSLSNWDFNRRHVQTELDGGEFLNAASTLISAGPPRIRQGIPRGSIVPSISLGTISGVAYPVGVVENIGVAQNRQLQRLFEIGSKRSYFVNGRVVGQINMARTMFHGPSLMRALYAYYPNAKLPAQIRGNVPELLDLLGNRFLDAAPTIRNEPGHGDFFINLDSDLFDQPFGLMFMLKDAENRPYGAFYIENAYLNGHQFNVNASSTLIGEAVSIQYDRMVPIDVNAVTRDAQAGTLRQVGIGTTDLSQP